MTELEHFVKSYAENIATHRQCQGIYDVNYILLIVLKIHHLISVILHQNNEIFYDSASKQGKQNVSIKIKHFGKDKTHNLFNETVIIE